MHRLFRFPYRCILIILLAIHLNARSQSSETDALLQKVYVAQNDREKLDAILEVCMRNDIRADIFNELAFASKDLARKSEDLYKIGMSAYLVAWAHYLNSNNDSARTEIDEALQKMTGKDPRLTDVRFKLKSFKATTFQSEQKNAEALRILFPLLEEEQKTGNRLFIAQTMHLIAIVESQQNNALKTIEWEKQALPLLDENNAGEDNVRATIYATLGKAFMQLNQADSAIFYNNKAMESFRKTHDLYNLAITLQRQAGLFTAKNDLPRAENILNELSGLHEKIHMGDGDMNYWMAFIHFYIQARDYDRAVSLIMERLEKAGNSGERNATHWGVRIAYYEALAKCYRAQGNLQAYARTLEDILQAKDSLYVLNSTEEIAGLQTKYEVQKKENTIMEQKLELSRKNAWMYGGILFSLLVSLMIWLHFRNNARRQQLQMQWQRQEDKMNAERAVHEAGEKERKRIAADLHDHLGSYAASIVANIQHLEHTNADTPALQELKGNAQSMVSTLSDTIWVLKKENMRLTAISDRVKVLVNRLIPSYPGVHMEVVEEIGEDILLQPSQAYQLFSIIHEAVNNALKHSRADTIRVNFRSLAGERPYVQVADNGTGQAEHLQAAESGNGLYNMRHRAEILGWEIRWIQNRGGGIGVEIRQNNTN